MIEEGKLSINGKRLSLGPHFVDPERDTVRLKGRKIFAKRPEAKVWMFHKPLRVLSTVSDPKGRPTVMDYLKPMLGRRERFFPVGRLDWDSEGLLLLSNDGDFADRVLHPKYETFKSYVVKLRGELRPKDIERLLYRGVSIPSSNRGSNRGNRDKRSAANRGSRGNNKGNGGDSKIKKQGESKKKALFVCRIDRKTSKKLNRASNQRSNRENSPRTLASSAPHSSPHSTSWAKLILNEGQKRQVRWMFESLGLPVQRLKRVAIGRLKLSRLPKGSFRQLEEKEIRKIFQRPKELASP